MWANAMTSVQQPSTKEDILVYLLKQGEATAQALAAHLEVSAQAIRRHLKDLENEELIEHHTAQEGMGRPNHLYCLSSKGRARFPAQYDEFAISLLDTLEKNRRQRSGGHHSAQTVGAEGPRISAPGRRRSGCRPGSQTGQFTPGRRVHGRMAPGRR